MKKYFLKTKCGETINQVMTESMELAIEYFADVKQLAKKDLVEIYDVI